MKKILLAMFLVLSSLTWGQVTVSSTGAPNFNGQAPAYPNQVLATATVTGTGNAVVNLPGFSTITIQVTGTYSSLNTAIQGSNDKTNFTTLTLYPVAGGPGITALTANGLYTASVPALTSLKILSSATFTGTSAIIRIVGSSAPLPVVPNFAAASAAAGLDPCLDKSITLKSVAVSITTATTTLLVDVSGTTKVYPCSFQATVGASTTVSFESGTSASTACDTAAALMTGVFTPGTAALLSIGAIGPTPASSQYCAVSTGTGGIKGVLNYKQL